MLVTCWMFLLEIVLAKSDVNININFVKSLLGFVQEKAIKQKSNLVGSTTEEKENSYLYYCFGIQSKVEISKDKIRNFLKPLIYNSGKK